MEIINDLIKRSNEAVFDLASFKKAPRYIRFEVWDSHNERAITRAYFPEEWA